MTAWKDVERRVARAEEPADLRKIRAKPKPRKKASKHRAFVASQRGSYETLLAAQDGHCALCPNGPGTRRLHIDHDHRTMKVRGLLCFRCNAALRGYLTPSWLRAAADYLERSEEEA